MTSQHQALLEAMEQQSVSIAKSGVVCSLPCRTAVLAAANPVGGHYDRAKTVSENLKLNPALLSRFDLVFILLDRPDSDLDGLLSDHIVRLHSSSGANASGSTASNGFLGSSLNGGGINLRERLRRQPNENIEPVPPELLKKYIAYARAYASPKLDAGAKKVLQEFYVELRCCRHRSLDGDDYAPVTLRQLESLIRLTEARARVELRELATAEDAQDVVEIMQASLADTLATSADSSSALDFSRSVHGSGTSTRGAAKKFVSALHRYAERNARNVFSVDEMKQVLASCGARVASFFDFLESLNTQGFLIKKSTKTYQLLTVDC